MASFLPVTGARCLGSDPSCVREEAVSGDQAHRPADPGEAARLSLAALAALALGVAVYLFIRGPQSVYFLPDWTGFKGWDPPVLRELTGSLPSLFHVYSFILLTTAALAPWRSVTPAICLFWFLFESLLEIGQHHLVAPVLGPVSPSFFSQVPCLETVPSFFLNGTFDPVDLAALAAGTLFAYMTILRIRKGRCTDAR